jgi:hypothetical protein
MLLRRAFASALPLVLGFLMLNVACRDATPPTASPSDAPRRVSLEQDVFYHVFQRSFYDSDGDRLGAGKTTGAYQRGQLAKTKPVPRSEQFSVSVG